MKLSMFLKKTEPDLDAAATLQVRKNVKEDKKLAKGEKESCRAPPKNKDKNRQRARRLALLQHYA